MVRMVSSCSASEDGDLDVPVVGDDAVVHHQELIVLVTALRVAVHIAGGAVGRPPGVRDTWAQD